MLSADSEKALHSAILYTPELQLPFLSGCNYCMIFDHNAYCTSCKSPQTLSISLVTVNAQERSHKSSVASLLVCQQLKATQTKASTKINGINAVVDVKAFFFNFIILNNTLKISSFKTCLQQLCNYLLGNLSVSVYCRWCYVSNCFMWD